MRRVQGMKKIMARAHQLARSMEGDYQARLTLALRMAWAESKKEDDGMRKKYEGYVKNWHMWESSEAQPMSFEEWKAREEERAAEKAAIAKAAESITIYAEFVQKAAAVDDEDDALIIARKMKNLHDDECMKLFRAGKLDEVAAHAEAYGAARKAIMAPFKNGAPKGPFAATNVYDNDDRPTTHK
jgi:hypothetical protein